MRCKKATYEYTSGNSRLTIIIAARVAGMELRIVREMSTRTNMGVSWSLELGKLVDLAVDKQTVLKLTGSCLKLFTNHRSLLLSPFSSLISRLSYRRSLFTLFSYCHLFSTCCSRLLPLLSSTLLFTCIVVLFVHHYTDGRLHAGSFLVQVSLEVARQSCELNYEYLLLWGKSTCEFD